ncbi:MAG: rhodanese-like domain-containing protein [Bacteroidetes bacterium]|nr:rhodanese-like domain-containing protein [Bacteroidota bacterium]MBL6962390.1 rhodanese-like domain-containing protein [Bacteroidota bacterium]
MSDLRLSVQDVIAQMEKGFRLLDLRKPDFFALSHIPKSLNLVLDESFEKHAKKFIFKDIGLLIITENGEEEEAIYQLEKKGYQNVKGYLEGGIDAWIAAGQKIDVVISVLADELAIELIHGGLYVYDIRLKSAFDQGHIEPSENIRADVLISDYSAIDNRDFCAIVCEDGRLSMSLISYLKINGKHNLYHAEGGFAGIKKEGGLELVKTANNSLNLTIRK